MISKLKQVLERAEQWPAEAQEQLADIALELETGIGVDYRATSDELAAIDQAERDGIATPNEVATAFKAFRRR